MDVKMNKIKNFHPQTLVIEKKTCIPYPVAVYYLCTFFRRF